MKSSELAILVFAIVRLVGSFGVIYLGVQDRRWIIIAWGIVGVMLSVPVAAIALGAHVADLPLAVIVGGHAFQTIAVGGAAISSRGEIRRLNEVLTTAGIDPERGTWRP